MDVDNDIDQSLMQQFSCMGTTDKDVLISQFQRLLDNQLNPAGCAFFLDMNNWNLQAAVCSYYDFEQPKDADIKLPTMAFVRDITIGEGESIPPNVKFTKTWRIQNIGNESWPPGCSLKFVQGDQLGLRDRVMVDALQPGQIADVSVEMVSPAEVGTYQGKWRMTTPTGLYFGDFIWVILTVDLGGLLQVTQQLSSIGGVGHASPLSSNVQNPFSSPEKLDSANNTANFSMIAQHGSPGNSPSQPSFSSFSSPARTSLFQGSENITQTSLQTYGGANTSIDELNQDTDMT